MKIRVDTAESGPNVANLFTRFHIPSSWLHSWLHKAPFAALGGRLVGMERAVVRGNEGRGRTLGDDLAELTSFAVLKEL